MSFMHKFNKAAFLSCFMVLLLNTAGWALSIPLPPDTKVMREETASVTGGDDKKVTLCESGLSEEKVASYYNKELEKRGYSIFMQQQNVSVYTKGDNLFVVLAKGSPSGNQKTNIILTESKIIKGGANPMAPQQCDELPSSIPAYPGAKCMSSMQLKNAGAESFKYSTMAEAEAVINFYRSQLVQGGWKIVQENKVEDLASKIKSSVSLPANIGAATMLVLESLRNERCTITVVPSVIMGSGTLITIMYEGPK